MWSRHTVLALLLSLLGTVAAQGFQLPAVSGDTLRVVILGDFNGSYGTVGYSGQVRDLLARIPGWEPGLVLLPGDLIAGQDRSLPETRFGEMWAGFDAQIAQPLREAGIPFAAAMGNHDASSLRSGGSFTYGRERLAAADYWESVRADLGVSGGDMSGYPFDWSFRLGGLFVIILDASSATLDPNQLEWLFGQLASEAARGADHRWLVGHLPLFGVAERRASAGEVLAGGAELARNLQAAGLDTYVSGHQGAWYPAEFEGLELLMTGGVGGRRLIQGTAKVRSTVTVVDISGTQVSYTTFDLSGGAPVPAGELPESIDAYGGRINRSGRAR